jgi:hypothetical protein
VPIVPRLDLSTDSGSPGADFSATGTGWADGEVRLLAHNSAVNGQLLDTATAANGRFQVDLKVPDIAFGPIEVVACQQCGSTDERRAVQPFSVVKGEQIGPALTLDPDDIRSGERIGVHGAGWSPEDGRVSVFLRPAGVRDRTPWFRVTPELSGIFDEAVQAPELEAGNYVVIACQRCHDAPGFPRATRILIVDDEGTNWLLVAAVAAGALIVIAIAIVVARRLLRRPAREPGTPTSSAPRVIPRPDPVFDVHVRGPPGVELPHLDVLAHPDPARLADQVEVSP